MTRKQTECLIEGDSGHGTSLCSKPCPLPPLAQQSLLPIFLLPQLFVQESRQIPPCTGCLLQAPTSGSPSGLGPLLRPARL